MYHVIAVPPPDAAYPVDRGRLGDRRAHDHACGSHRSGDAQLWHEVRGSRLELQRRFHVSVDFFCYPSGRYNARVIAPVQRAGYLGSTTTNYGLARPPRFYELNRVRISGTDGVSGVARKLKDLVQ